MLGSLCTSAYKWETTGTQCPKATLCSFGKALVSTIPGERFCVEAPVHAVKEVTPGLIAYRPVVQVQNGTVLFTFEKCFDMDNEYDYDYESHWNSVLEIVPP